MRGSWLRPKSRLKPRKGANSSTTSFAGRRVEFGRGRSRRGRGLKRLVHHIFGVLKSDGLVTLIDQRLDLGFGDLNGHRSGLLRSLCPRHDARAHRACRRSWAGRPKAIVPMRRPAESTCYNWPKFRRCTEKMLFRLKHQDGKPEFYPYPQQDAAALQLVEKDLENWLAAHPELLFGAEPVLVIGQSVSGKKMADILALDGDGRLLIIEMKRDWSDRATVGQLLEYAARMADEGTHEQLDRIARNYLKQPEIPLSTRFHQFFDNETGEEVKLGSTQRLVVVAPGADEDLRRIVRWLKASGVAIDFVPFKLFSSGDGGDIFIDIEPLPKIQTPAQPSSMSAPSPWGGDWSFNTNETYAPGAYVKMFEQGVIAIYGYETGPENLRGSKPGERVLAFVNRKGVMAA